MVIIFQSTPLCHKQLPEARILIDLFQIEINDDRITGPAATCTCLFVCVCVCVCVLSVRELVGDGVNERMAIGTSL